jgi:hypothetical protein
MVSLPRNNDMLLLKAGTLAMALSKIVFGIFFFDEELMADFNEPSAVGSSLI